MSSLQIDINRETVYSEVATTTAYTGEKLGGDGYEQIFTTEGDREALTRFWNECVSDSCEALKQYLASETATSDGHRFTLELSASHDDTLNGAMSKDLQSFFVTAITAKWFVYANKAEAETYAASASSVLEACRRKACAKRKPTRPTYT